MPGDLFGSVPIHFIDLDEIDPVLTHQSVIKTTFLLYHAAVSAIAGG